ncbi:Rha family transcriptional regulator [Xenorhabdus lircayensis]|uniref:Rha family transcriptional regulator n=1 Tax=Xenorhabdus lircayensis TaxID=2763499 RepID=A0ABS0U0V5_9GAMM|nr:Rha family transcriptional regulator [Xenorhabdus lircayensis]MBI6547252.1 Rha family transcriptional regulator [Xenorhabdus lircayensis]
MKLVTTKKANFPVTEAPTMTSLEMVDYINADRKAKAEAEGLTFPCKKYRKLRHSDFTKKVPRVLGEEYAKNFSHPIKNQQNGEIYPGYKFPKRESCLMAMSYNYELQAQVFDHMTDLEAKSGFGFTIQQLQNMLSLARKASDEDSSDAGRRLRRRQDDLVILNKAENVIGVLGQMAIELVGGGKEMIAHER